MTRDEIIRMAREAGFKVMDEDEHQYAYIADTLCHIDVAVERFAALVAAAEREECAKVCDDQKAALEQTREEPIRENDFSELSWIGLKALIFQCKWLALTIRARGQS